MNCTIYMVSCNSTTHAIYPLTFPTYKYNELQGQLQNIPFFHSDKLLKTQRFTKTKVKVKV
jgi:hypothetical protein